MNARRVALILAAGLSAMLGGCPPPGPEAFVSLETLAGEYNANAAKVDRLWARARIRVTVSDRKGRSVSWGSASSLSSPNALLMLSKKTARAEAPVDFVLIGREMTELFRAGVDARNGLYYFWFNPGPESQAWFGQERYAGAPQVNAMPINPLQLVDILGLTELPAATPSMPAVVMTLQTDPYAYVVRYLDRQPVSERPKIWREVYFRWSDTQPRRPFKIKLYDAAGLCRVVAEVSDYKPIATDGQGQAPVMPTDLRLTWPAIRNVQTTSSLHMKLSEMTMINPFLDKVFDFRSHLPPGLTKVTQVDAAYGPVKEQGQDR